MVVIYLLMVVIYLLAIVVGFLFGCFIKPLWLGILLAGICGGLLGHFGHKLITYIK